MNKEHQRIAIAEACGWRECYVNQNGEPWGFARGLQYSQRIPDYLNDLNAMHEAEKVLNLDQQKRFIEWLIDGCVHDDYCTEMLWDSAWLASHATAAQRAQAFLRTLNLWKE